MSATKEFTLSDVSEHTSKKDLYLVVHEKVYDCSAFVDEHPGGEEVMLDVGGQDATEAFEDVGHSDEAREILEGMLVGKVARGANDPPAKSYSEANSSVASKGASGGLGGSTLVLVLAGAVIAAGAYFYLQQQDSSK